MIDLDAAFAPRFFEPREVFLNSLRAEVEAMLKKELAGVRSAGMQVQSRVKLKVSAQKKDYSRSGRMHDLLGLRIVTMNSSQFDLVEKLLLALALEKEMEFVTEEDQFKERRALGYRAHHYNFSLPKSCWRSLHEHAGLEVQVTSYSWFLLGEIMRAKHYKTRPASPKEVKVLKSLEAKALSFDSALAMLELDEDSPS